MGTITKTILQHIERFRQKQMKLDEWTQLGWEDAADYFHGSDKENGTSQFSVAAVVQSQRDDDAAAPSLQTFGEPMESLEIVLGILEMLKGTSRPGSSHNSLGAVKPQSNTSISGLELCHLCRKRRLLNL